MENRKPFVIAIIVLIILATGWIMISIFRGIANSEKTKTSDEEKSSIKESIEINDSGISVASGVDQGVISDISGKKIAFKVKNETKTVIATSGTTIYMNDGTRDMDKTLSDLKIGSLVTVIYASQSGNLAALGIRIDKL